VRAAAEGRGGSRVGAPFPATTRARRPAAGGCPAPCLVARAAVLHEEGGYVNPALITLGTLPIFTK